MINRNLTITISGDSCSGKSNLLYLLKEFLKQQEITVIYDSNFDYKTEIEFDDAIKLNNDKVINLIKTDGSVLLREVSNIKKYTI